jgi:hypothetical protein
MSPLEDPDIAKIANLKIVREFERANREIQDERSRKKSELAFRGLATSGPMIAAMQDFELRRMEAHLRAVYAAWKEALVETGNDLTPDSLEKIRDKALEVPEGAPTRIAASLREQFRGMDDICDPIPRQIEQEVYSIRARFLQDAEIEITKARVALRSKQVAPPPGPIATSNTAEINLLQDEDAKKMVLEILHNYLIEGKATPKHPMRRKYAEKRTECGRSLIGT